MYTAIKREREKERGRGREGEGEGKIGQADRQTGDGER